METSVLTPHCFNFSYFMPLILLATTMCVRCFHGKPEGLIDRVSASLFFGGKPGGVTGKEVSVLRYCNNEDVKLLQIVQGSFVSSRLILND